MEKFIYKILKIDLSDNNAKEDFEQGMNKLGENGWELVNIISNIGLGSSKYSLVGINNNYYAILKKKQ